MLKYCGAQISNMDKSYTISLLILLALVVVAILFYTNPYENHRESAIGLCELACKHIAQNSTILSSSQICLYKNISFSYSCAVSPVQNQSICGNPTTIYLSNSCSLESIG
jgi:hypothetical protein